mgnify:CR=1 FL=1
MEQSLAPVVLFVYNRLEATKATIECLKDNYDAEKTDVFFFSDNAKKESQQDNVNQVREYIHKVTGFRSICIFEAEKNKGLAKSVISGVTDVINQYGRVIVLEDDILTSKCFLRFMNGALDYYEKVEKIWSISGYQFPFDVPDNYNDTVYYFYRSSSWGWATWKNRWNSIDWSVKEYSRYRFNPFMIYDFCKGGTDLDKMLRYQMKGKIDSWAIRWCFAQYLQSKWTVYPIHSLVNNIGTDGTGTHCDPTSVRFQRNIDNDFNFRFLNRVEIDSEIARRLKKTVDRSVTRKLKRLLRLN